MHESPPPLMSYWRGLPWPALQYRAPFNQKFQPKTRLFEVTIGTMEKMEKQLFLLVLLLFEKRKEKKIIDSEFSIDRVSCRRVKGCPKT